MGRVYCSLIVFVFIAIASSTAQTKRIVVWDGETALKASGWTNPAIGCSLGPQSMEAHSGKTALEFKFDYKSPEGTWCGAGWNLADMQVGPYGTDITDMKYFSFWLKVKGKTANLAFNLLCNGAPALDQPQHHTEKVIVSKYCPQWKDGQWHEVIIPLKDLVQPAGFDPRHVAEFQFFNTGAGHGSFLIDDISFDIQ